MLFYKALINRVVKRLFSPRQENSFMNVILTNKLDDFSGSEKLLSEGRARIGTIDEPKLYIDGSICYCRPLSAKLPCLEIFRLNNVTLLSGSDAIISSDKMYHYELSLMKPFHDLKRSDLFEPIGDSMFRVNIGRRSCLKDKPVVSLLKEHSSNYYHWFTEVLPRLIKVLESINSDDILLLVDRAVSAQGINALEKIMSNFSNIRYTIYYAEIGESFDCDELIYCTPLWLSLDNTTMLPHPESEFFVSKDNLKQIRTLLIEAARNDDNNLPKERKKIYLQRLNNRLRRVTNIVDLEKLLLKRGFVFVDTARLSISEQVQLFNEAEVVIGVSGAAFTNILFMSARAKAISLYPSTQSTNYYVFQPLADVSGVELVHFLTDPVDEFGSVHSDLKVDIQKLDNALSELL